MLAVGRAECEKVCGNVRTVDPASSYVRCVVNILLMNGAKARSAWQDGV